MNKLSSTQLDPSHDLSTSRGVHAKVPSWVQANTPIVDSTQSFQTETMNDESSEGTCCEYALDIFNAGGQGSGKVVCKFRRTLRSEDYSMHA